jgi:aryl-alcohol dehydrogenase-like predicted oxidoreductase
MERAPGRDVDEARRLTGDRLQAPWLAAHPGEFYVATKTGERTGDAARAELERSLTRLGIDRVDLVQLHNLVEDDEWETAHGPGGAVEALLEAQSEGLVGHIGVTGHGLRIAGMHLRSIERFPFDTVLFPYSYVLMQEPDYRRDADELLARCAERGIAIQTIKSIARRRWVDGDTAPKHSWYEPLRDDDAVARAVRYVLGDERVFLNSTSDASLLPIVLAAAERPDHASRPDEAELEADVVAHGMRRLFDGDALERI